MKTLQAVSLFACLSGLFAAEAAERPWLVVNEDNDHYFLLNSNLMNRAALERYVDNIAQGHVTHFFMCVNGQRTSYDSKTWEPIWEGLDDPARKDSATWKDGTHDRWAVHAKMLFDAGIDPYEVWTKRCREKGVSPWISMRMNDTHFATCSNYFRSARFVRNRRDLWRRPNGDPSKWGTAGLDYAQREAWLYALDQVREIANRWDSDGIELDWMRGFAQNLRPRHEREDAHYLTDFMRAARYEVNEAAKRHGHPMKLAVRVPRSWYTAKSLGLNVVDWAKEGLVDVVISVAGVHVDTNMPVDQWISVLAEANPTVMYLPTIDCVFAPVGDPKAQNMTIEHYRGVAETFYKKGAKGLYLFNAQYYGSIDGYRKDRAAFDIICAEGLAPETIATKSKITIDTYNDFPDWVWEGPTDVPPLMRTFDGKPVTTREEWEKVRKPEIRERFLSQMYGKRPAAAEKPDVRFERAEPDRVMMDGKAVRKRIRCSYRGPYGESSFTFTAFIPKTAKPAPSFVLICNRDPKKNLDPERVVKSDFWPAEEIVSRGYAAISFFNGDVAKDATWAFTNGVFGVYEKPYERTGESWGILSAWAWGASRVMDWIETEPTLDAKHVGVVGHSRGGKTALLAGVMDERFAMLCSNDSGCCGAKLNHMLMPGSEHFDQIIDAISCWFCTNFSQYRLRDAEIDFDQHMLVALLAPRLVAIGSAVFDSWAGPEGEYYTGRFASPAWELYGRKGLVGDKFPRENNPLQEGCVSYHERTGGHDLTKYDWARYLDFADRHGWRQKTSAFRAADAIVVWNPETGVNKDGKALTKDALVDLTNVLAKVTGRVPAVYVEGKEPADAKAAIYLGDTKAARAAGCSDVGLRRGDWQIRNVPGRAYLFAKAGMGTTYAMSDFVERYLGYWFLTPEGDDPYDFNPTLEVPLADVTVKPSVYNARIYTANGGWYSAFARRRRAPGYPYSEIEGGERLSRQMRENHTSFTYLPPKKYFKDHPEWYSMVGGRRQYTPVGQICMSNPEARKECLKNLLAFAAKDRADNPTDYPCLYDFTQQDNMSYLCECPECQKVIAKYTRGKDPKGHGDNYNGGDAGLQLEFINWIATEAKKVYPDIKVRTFAYVSTECPPKPGTIVPADNVRIWWCDLYGESEHHRALTDGPFNYRRAEQVGEWMRIAKEVEIWDYMLYGGSYNGDYPEWSPDGIAGDGKFFAKNRLSSMFMETERNGGPAYGLSELPQTFYELNFYLLSVFYTYPDADLDALVKNYCRVYGKGADKMREALAFLREITMANPTKSFADWHQRRCAWRTVANWEKFRALVKAAYDAESAGSARTRIARVLASVATELARLYAQDPAAKEKCAAARKDFATYAFEYVRGLPIDEVWRKKLLDCVQTKVDLFDLKFKDLPEGLGDVPQDELRCADWHRFSGASNASTREDPDSETGKGRVWQFGKDNGIHKGFPVPCWMYDAILKNGQNYKITAEMAAKDEKYHWYKLGPGYVGQDAVFAMPGDWHMTFRFSDWYIQKDGLPVDPNWYDVYLSAKFTGPAYVPGSTKPNGIWFDRLLLRRIAPPASRR